jgi:hypothetical protein
MNEYDLDLMEYVGPIEIKVIPNKGRGVFAT